MLVARYQDISKTEKRKVKGWIGRERIGRRKGRRDEEMEIKKENENIFEKSK